MEGNDVDRAAAWALDQGFTMLGRSVRIRTTSGGCAEMVLRLFGSCRSDVPDDAVTFELSERGDRDHSAQLVRDGEILIRNASAADVFELLVWQVMNDAVSDAHDLLVIHAGAAVSPRGGAVVLPAGSGSGKTTLTAALVMAGFAYLSDEMGVFDPSTLQVIPAPRGLSVKDGTFQAIGLPAPELSSDAARFLQGSLPVSPEDLNGSIGEPAEVRAIVAPAYRPGATTLLEPVSRASGLMDLASNGFNLPAFGASRGVHLLGRIVSAASCYRLTIGALDEAVEAVAGLSCFG